MTSECGVDSAQQAQDALTDLILAVEAGGSRPVAALQAFLAPRLRWYLRRKLGRDQVEPEVSAASELLLATAFLDGPPTVPELMSMCRLAALSVCEGASQGPARRVRTERKSVEAMKETLAQFNPREREALTRYLNGEEADRVCGDLGVSLAAFSAMRRRLKIRFDETLHKPEEPAEIRLHARQASSTA